jgi:hypothetical protein
VRGPSVLATPSLENFHATAKDNRWQSGNSDVVLSNDPNYDPNHDPDAAHTDYKRSGVRPR